MKSIKSHISNIEVDLFRKEIPFPVGTLIRCFRKDQAIIDMSDGYFGVYTCTPRLGFP